MDAPHKKRGWLRNNNPPGDFTQAPRCLAKNRKQTLCQSPAMQNGRCRFHGGKSTGPRTPEGKAKAAKANYKHGMYSAESKRLLAHIRELGRQWKQLSQQC